MVRRSNYIKIFLWILVISMTVPVLIGCFFGVPSADDFSNGRGWILYQGNHLKYVFNNMIKIYTGWQGTYFSTILAGIPLYYISGYMGLRIFLLLNALLFFTSLYIFVKYSIKWFDIKKKGIESFLYAMGIIYLLCNNNLGEIFYWYTGICVYTLPLSCMLLCFSCYIAYEDTCQNKFILLGCALAFLAAGGALDIAAMSCAVLLFGVLYDCIVGGKIKKNAFIGVATLLGAIINSVAPGNFVRHSVIDEKMRPIQISVDLIFRINEIISSEIKNGFLLLLFVVAFIWSCKHLESSNKKFKYPVLVSLYAYFAIFITDFPVALGYSKGYSMPDRCAFVENLAIVFFITLCAIYWGGWSAQRKIFYFTRETLFIIAIICMIPLSTYFNLTSLIELVPYKMILHMAKGDYKRASEREENIIKQIENAQNKDVIVYSEKEAEGEWTNLKEIEIDSDSEFWVNRAIAEYYNLDTVKLEYINE